MNPKNIVNFILSISFVCLALYINSNTNRLLELYTYPQTMIITIQNILTIICMIIAFELFNGVIENV